MDRELILNAEKFNKRRRRKKLWQKAVSVLGCIVVFCTTYALILPAITQEREVFCGLEAHTHDESCYTQVTEAGKATLVCTAETLNVHVHSTDCYDTEGNLQCGQADFLVHTHDASCLDADGALICTLPEMDGHVHGESCYSVEGGHTHGEDCYSVQRGALTCTLAEEAGHTHSGDCYVPTEQLQCTLTENHVHSEDCYTLGDLACTVPENHTHGDECTETTLTCTLAEDESHTHGEGCYAEELICTVPEGHVHSESCYGQALICTEAENHVHEGGCYEQLLQCETPESQGHTHEDACYEQISELTCTLEETPGEQVLICTEAGAQVHVHSESCFQTVTEQVLTCTQEEGETHTHSAMCYGTWELTCGLQEHAHELICYSNPAADVETAEVWEKTFADVQLTGRWAEDVLAIAQSQLGYRESTDNYVVAEDGQSIKGYTRYGAWYGVPYGDWCAMYASFCLHYAGVEDMPLESSVTRWIEALSAEEYGLYNPVGSYVPQAGELVFFDWEQDGDPDHVGIVAEVIAASETEPLKIKTIEGNSADQVQYVTYELADPAILGFGALPYLLTEEEQAEVDEVIAQIDAMPSADEIDAQLLAYEEAEDYEGMEEWYTEAVQHVCYVYQSYSLLTDTQKAKVTNADKLLELEYIWSANVLIDEITSDAPTAIDSASTSDFIELNLYDYNSKINTNYNSNNAWPGFQWNGGAYMNGTYNRNKIDYIDFGNSLITDFEYAGSDLGKATTAQNIGNQGGNINKIVEYPDGDYANKPIGMSTGTEVLSRTLNADGYPEVIGAGSMEDYFSTSTFATKQNTTSIDGLFQKNEVTGEYYYNSRWNHAQYSNNKFTLYEDIITPNFITYPFGNFLPFNTITDSSKATQVSKITHVASDASSNSEGYIQILINRLLNSTDPSEKQLWNMLAKYRDSLGAYKDYDTIRYSWSAKDAILAYIGSGPTDDTGPITDALLEKMYNIDWDVETNFFFGMEMKMNFMQPKGGMTGNDTNNDGEADYPMVFYFTGDDDVWVYVDGALFLDLSGIHRHVGGEIDFVNGKVHYYALNTETGDVDTTPYATYTFAELLAAAGKSTSGLNDNGTFTDYTTHSFNFYYMERGSGSSVCRLNFNFPLLRQNSITVEKALTADSDVETLGNPSYPFQVLKANTDGSKTETLLIAAETPYTLYDVDGTVIQEVRVTKNPDGSIASTSVVDASGNAIEDSKILKTDANGVLWLKAGQKAEFVGINENAGKYYVRELLDEVTLPQYGQITVSGSSTTKVENVTVGGTTFTGADSPVMDMSDGATIFRFTNDIDTAKLSNLSVSKNLTEYDAQRDPINYDIEITLDGVLLPVGTEYTVGSETRKVETAGIITVNQYETAVISNILAGSAFTVQETSGSAEGYIVTYMYSGGDSVSVQDGKVVVGKLKTDADVKITINNSEKGATVNIPGTKSLSQYDGLEHSYTIRLTQVTDSTGKIPVDGVPEFTKTAAVTEAPGEFLFELKYVLVDLDSLPKKVYYRITEDTPTDGVTLPNSTVYVVEVTITEDGSGGISAAVTNLWKGISGADGPEGLAECEAISADFVNTLAGDLTVSKTVDGDTAAQNADYQFNLTITAGESGTVIDGEYIAILTDNTGQQTQQVITVQDGVPISFSMKHGESLTVKDLPYGAVWTVQETSVGEFKVTNTVTAGQTTQSGEGASTTGSVVTEGTTVAYTNTILYLLPETGGTGTTLYTMAGLMLMLLSAAYLMYRTHMRRKEGS